MAGDKRNKSFYVLGNARKNLCAQKNAAKESRAMERELKEPESYQKSTSRVSQTKQNPYFSFQCLFHLKVKLGTSTT
jgi:regulatory protein YycH of two-component signal transduction system YycFG